MPPDNGELRSLNFQVVLQCLYSQCQTAQFGSALHHALSKCSSLETEIADISPPLLREQGLRKRNKRAVGDMSDPGSAPAIGSVARQSASASATLKHPTRSLASADLKRRDVHPTRSVATFEVEKRNPLPTRSVVTLALEKRYADPTRSVETLALERRNAAPAEATSTGASAEATPVEATATEGTTTEATATKATPAEATPAEVTPTDATPPEPTPSSAASPPKATRSAVQRRNHAHLPLAAESRAARR